MMKNKQPTGRCGGLALAVVISSLLITGCAQQPKPLYGWGNYQGQVYEYFKGQNTRAEAQIAVLEADFQRMRASGATPPPGFHAHLGMLYNAIGKDDQALQQFNTEKGLFPESSHYIDFLLAQAKK